MKWLILLAIVLIAIYSVYKYSDNDLGWNKEDMTSEEEKELCEKMRSTFKIKTGVTWGTSPENVRREYLRLGCEDNAPVAYDPTTAYPSYGKRNYSMASAQQLDSNPELTLGG